MRRQFASLRRQWLPGAMEEPFARTGRTLPLPVAEKLVMIAPLLFPRMASLQGLAASAPHLPLPRLKQTNLMGGTAQRFRPCGMRRHLHLTVLARLVAASDAPLAAPGLQVLKLPGSASAGRWTSPRPFALPMARWTATGLFVPILAPLTVESTANRFMVFEKLLGCAGSGLIRTDIFGVIMLWRILAHVVLLPKNVLKGLTPSPSRMMAFLKATDGTLSAFATRGHTIHLSYIIAWHRPLLTPLTAKSPRRGSGTLRARNFARLGTPLESVARLIREQIPHARSTGLRLQMRPPPVAIWTKRLPFPAMGAAAKLLLSRTCGVL